MNHGRHAARPSAWAAALLLIMQGTCATAQSVTSTSAGRLADGRPVEAFTLTSGKGMTVRILNYGGIITSIRVPDRNGKPKNVLLSLASLGDYEKRTNFSAIVGRYANRISHGGISINGRYFKLASDAKGIISHGGQGGLSAQLWNGRAYAEQGRVGVSLSVVSPDGANGFPGTLRVEVRYSVGADDTLRIEYRATSDKDTVVNLTNHAFFNLAGEDSGVTDDQWIKIFARSFTPVDDRRLPTGVVAPVSGTALDLTRWRRIGDRVREADPQLLGAHGFDHNFVLDRRTGALGVAACAYDPASGRSLVVATTEPGVQFYTGNGFDGTLTGGDGRTVRQGDGFALETQHFPDSPNNLNFPSTLLRRGAEFRSRTEFRFGSLEAEGPPLGSIADALTLAGCNEEASPDPRVRATSRR